jgi:hypothetical protein
LRDGKSRTAKGCSAVCSQRAKRITISLEGCRDALKKFHQTRAVLELTFVPSANQLAKQILMADGS